MDRNDSVTLESSVLSADALTQLESASAGDVQKIAASQVKLLDRFYATALKQAKFSFNWALVIAGVGVLFFMSSVALLLWRGLEKGAIITVIAGAVVEVIAGVVFTLYGRTTEQLGNFRDSLDFTQRLLLANSICESIGAPEKDATRAALVMEVMRTRVGLRPVGQRKVSTSAPGKQERNRPKGAQRAHA